MKSALPTLLHQNPFLVLGIPLDASARDIRYRLDELEMEASLGESEANRAELTLARHLLEDPMRRIECELLAPWSGVTVYADAAPDHDVALDSLHRVMDRKRVLRRQESTSAVDVWVDLANTSSMILAVQRRLDNLGVQMRAREWLHEMFASLLAQLVARVIERDGSLVPSLCRMVVRLDRDLVAPSCAVLSQNIGEQLKRERLEALPERQRIRLIAIVNEALLPLREHAPDVWQELLSTLAESVNTLAWALCNKGDRRSAERLLTALVNIGLPEADAIENQGDLAAIHAHTAKGASKR